MVTHASQAKEGGEHHCPFLTIDASADPTSIHPTLQAWTTTGTAMVSMDGARGCTSLRKLTRAAERRRDRDDDRESERGSRRSRDRSLSRERERRRDDRHDDERGARHRDDDRSRDEERHRVGLARRGRGPQRSRRGVHKLTLGPSFLCLYNTAPLSLSIQVAFSPTAQILDH